MAAASKVSSPFSGFPNGGVLCDVLTRPHNQDLKAFAVKLFQQVSTANESGRQERFIDKDRIFLDAVAQILAGDEVCAAIAISGSDILIATNQGTQDRRAVSWSITATVLEKRRSTGSLSLGFKCVLQPKDGDKIEKRIGPVCYQFDAREEKGIITRLHEKLEFCFSEGEFPYLPDDEVAVGVDLLQKLDKTFFFSFFDLEQGEEVPLQRPIVTCRGALKRRTAKVFAHLSLISNAILRRNSQRPEKVPSRVKHYARYLEDKYCRYQKTPQQGNEDAFIESLRYDCAITLDLDRPGGDTTAIFLEGARAYYKDIALKDRVFTYLEQHDGWVKILNDSLTYELSRVEEFKKHIHVSSKPPVGIKELDLVYNNLIRSYIDYKKRLSLKTSVASVIAWVDTLKPDPLLLPSFVADNFGQFHKMARRYFIQLAVAEQYIVEDAERDGPLANRIKDETIFKEPGVIIVEGAEDVHAEMRLFSYHLLQKALTAPYYGIAKLCCALCNYTLRQFQAAGLHPPETRGTHATLFTWPLPEAFYQNPHMERFLGRHLFEMYSRLPIERRLESEKKGSYYLLQDVCKAIISRLDGMNSVRNLEKLGIDPSFLIPGAQGQYADNFSPPKLPSNCSAFGLERKLEDLRTQHGQNLHPDFFKPLMEIGKGWKELDRKDVAVYYLEFAAKIFDQFPDDIDRGEAAKLFNILGNACRSLELYDKASTYLLKALQMRKVLYREDSTEVISTLNNLGCLYHCQGKFGNASDHYNQALQQAGKANADNLVAKIRENLRKMNEDQISAFAAPAEEERKV